MTDFDDTAGLDGRPGGAPNAGAARSGPFEQDPVPANDELPVPGQHGECSEPPRRPHLTGDLSALDRLRAEEAR